MQKNPKPLLCLRNTCTLGTSLITGISHDSLSFVTVVSVTMNSLRWKSPGLINLPLWTPTLTRPFSLHHAHQISEAIEKRRLSDRLKYLRRTEDYKDPEAIEQPWHTHWAKLRYANDPTFRAERNEYRRNYYINNLKDNENHLLRSRIKHWVFEHAWVREELPWQHYQPIVYNRLTEHHCAGCGWIRPGGRRLYWQSLVDTDRYLCHRCHIPLQNPDWNTILPKGYEDIRDFRALKTRKKQLDVSKASPP
jgi:hypothetical protein